MVFNCNHCPYAQAWEGRLISTQHDYADQGLAMVIISSNDANALPADGFDRMKKRAEAKGYPFPYLYDESQGVARAYGAERTPELFLSTKIDACGITALWTTTTSALRT